MKPFLEINADDLEAIELRNQMGEHGYAMIRGLLPSQSLNGLLGEIIVVLRDVGWIAPSRDSLERVAMASAACADGESSYKPTRDKVFGLQSLHALPHNPQLQKLMKLLVGDKLLIHPKPETRLIFPNFERGLVRAHQDHTAVAGDSESFTAWVALHDCPLDQGPLRILDGSNRFGLQPTIGDTGYIARSLEQGNGWMGGEIRAGDVLLFHSLTVHEALPNRSNRLRISLDFRFQSYERPVNPATFVFTGSGKRSWENVYAGWTSGELKYYWTRLPLRLKPSKSELAELARTAESPKMRERYSRILERLPSQVTNA